MCFLRASSTFRCWVQNTSRIYNKEVCNPYLMYRPAEKAPVFFLGVGPITHLYLHSVNQVVVAMAVKGIVAHAVDMTTPTDRCGHPPYNSHVMMYQQARPIISKALGWD